MTSGISGRRPAPSVAAPPPSGGGGAGAFLEAHPDGPGTFVRMAGATPAGAATRDAFEAITAGAGARQGRAPDGRALRELGPADARPMDLGPAAVIEAGLVSIVVTSICGSAHDPGFYALHGLDVTRTGVLCVKAKNHFRTAFGASFAKLIDIDAPGPAALDIAQFPFRLAPPELYPLRGLE